jgi:hypothetical protein
MAGERIVLAELDLDVQKLLQASMESKTAIMALKAEQSELKKSGEEGSAQFIRNEVELRRLSAAYRLQTTAVQAQVSEGGKLVNQQAALAETVDRLNQTENEYRKNNADLLKLRKDLNVTSATYQKDLDAINAKINENNNWIKGNVSEYEKQKIAVGGYSEGIKEAIKDTGIFSGALGAVGADSSGVVDVMKSFTPILTDIGDKLKEAVTDLGLLKTTQTAAAVETEVLATSTTVLAAAEDVAAASATTLAAGSEAVTVAQEVQATTAAVATAGAEAVSTAQVAQNATARGAATGTNILSGALTILQLVLDALGIGLIIAAVVLLIAAFKSFTPLIDKIEQGFAAVTAVFQVLINAVIAFVSGAKSLTDAFSGLGSSMSQAADDAIKLKKAQQDLEDAMALQEIQSARNRAEINRLNVQAKDRTKTEEERLAMLQKASDLEDQDFQQRKKNADEALRIAQEQIRQDAELTEEEFKQLKKQGLNYKEYIEEKTNGVDELFEALSKAQLDQIALENEFYTNMEKNINKRNKLIEDAEKAAAKVLEDRKKAEEAATKARLENEKKLQDALTAYAQKLKLELDIFLQVQDQKAKSVEEEIRLAEAVRVKKIDIAKADFNASKKTANDELALRKATNQANLDFMKSQQEAVITNAENEFKAIQRANQSKLDSNKFLNEEILNNELERINTLAQAERDLLKVKLGETEAYQIEEQRINDEAQKKKDELKQQRDEEERSRKIADLENQKVINEENFILQMETERERLQLQRDQEIAEASKTGADLTLIRAKYAQLDKDIDKSVKDFKLQQRADLISGLKGLFGQESNLGKAVSIAEIVNSTVTNAAKAFQQASVFASNPLTAALAVNSAIQGGIIIATGATQVAKTVGAKFEKGGLQEVGGNRHSSGGTIFTGADGTQFEAERGELIGVMNRNAARHFMAFNNSFPAGGSSSSNYFENGGIVSREIAPPLINAEELASRISEAVSNIPPPVVGVYDIIDGVNKEVTVKQYTHF